MFILFVAVLTLALLGDVPITAAAQGTVPALRPPEGGCTLPTVDGDLTDLESFANCIRTPDGCGFVVQDPEQDICASNTFVPCDTVIACPEGGSSVYFANGADIVLAIYAYDRATDTFFAGLRVPSGHEIGDADGGWTANDDCARSNIIDQPGIGPSEPYYILIDTTCDGKPEFSVEVSGNALKLNGVPVPAGQGTFATIGSSLELSIEGLDLPWVVTFSSRTGFLFDGLQEENTEPVRSVEPKTSIDVACSGPTSIGPGQTGDFTVTTTNIGDALLSSVSGTVTLPAGLSLVQILDQDGWDTANENIGVITTTEPTLGVGGTLTLSFRVQAAEDCFGEVLTIASSGQGSFSVPGCVNEIISQDVSECPVACGATGVGAGSDVTLFKPAPNPFTQSSRMTYAISGSSDERVEITVYNTAGQQIRTLVNGLQPAGRHEVTWDGRDEKGAIVPAGVYLFRAEISGQSTVSRVTLVR